MMKKENVNFCVKKVDYDRPLQLKVTSESGRFARDDVLKNSVLHGLSPRRTPGGM